MFNGVEYVREVCKQRKIAISTLEKDCGFANGYLNPKKLTKLPYDRAVIIAKYLDLSVDYLLTGEERTVDYVVKTDDGNELLVETYYLNEETTKMAQKIFENKELRMLFDAAQDADAADLETVHSMLLALKRKERGTVDN